MSRTGPALSVFCTSVLVAMLAMFLAAPANAEPRHGLSAFGDLRYGADFKHFSYVSPAAPKGGRLALVGSGGRITFDSFNAFILKGDPAQGLELLFDTLMVRAFDEPDAMYGLVARSAEVAPDRSAVTFTLRGEARFADGSALTAEDVVYSFNVLKEKGHPSFRMSLRDVVKAEAPDAATVRFTLKGDQTRDLPLVVAALPILSKAYYATREFDATTLEPPLGSGPYRIGDFRQGSSVTYVRRPDYWAKDLPVNVGRYNFDQVRLEYFRDRTAALEALKAGAYDLREEFTARDWATAYDVPQVRDGRIARLTMPDARPSGAQGFFLNTRRGKFQDVRVRRAMNLAFDYEWTNKNIFFDLYIRTHSFFENSPLKAAGPPSAAELQLLEPFRAKLGAEVFGAPFVPPVSDGSGSDRRHLREAARLLSEAGWDVKDGRRVNGAGETLDVEFLINEPSFERVIQPYVRNLVAIGINASIRRVDSAQYERRVKGFDFDVVTQRYVMRLTPGVELKSYFSSESAATDGSFNLAGVRDPVIDALVAKVLEARTRDELQTAARALDRVIRSGHYWVPHWYKASHNIAHWNRFSRPADKPPYADGVIDTWWHDPEKAAKLP
jgi:microcin C transport system substrate-binding protein